VKLIRHMGLTVSLLVLVLTSVAQEKAVMESSHADREVTLDTNPNSPFWHAAHPLYAEVDPSGRELREFRTEVRSRWTKENIYFLFMCPYQHLYLKPAPDVAHETYQLWNWNVAEIFIGSDFDHIRRYKEFEVSPQNEWIDLDIDLNKPHHEQGWVWNSGFEHSARIDQTKHIWYAALRIPFAALGVVVPAPGTTLRVNLFRTEGSPEQQKEIMWRPTMSTTFHVPERFGLLRLAEN
jgi:Carbohydrate family 9 binding domain-like